MGIHYDYKSTRGAKAMEKQAKREKKLAEKRAKKQAKAQEKGLVEKIKNEMSKMGIENVYSATSPLDAIKTLEKNASISNNVIVSGSFELVGPIREFLLNSQGRL